MRDIAVAGDFLYWSDAAGVHRRRRDTGHIETVVPGPDFFGLAPTAEALFYSDGDGIIHRYSSRSGNDTVFVRSALMALDDHRAVGEWVYWTDRHMKPYDRRDPRDELWRAAIASGAAEPVVTGLERLSSYCVRGAEVILLDLGMRTSRPPHAADAAIVVVSPGQEPRRLPLGSGDVSGLALDDGHAYTVATLDGEEWLVSVQLTDGAVERLRRLAEGTSVETIDAEFIYVIEAGGALVRVPRVKAP